MSSNSTYRLPESLNRDLEEVRLRSAEFRQGELSAARFQAFRVPQGVYEQRESGTYMLRARLAAGIVTPEQMRAAAEVALAFGNGTVHFTSRQDLQIHGVRVEGIHPALVRLADAGLSTKGGGGNTVRNIAACPLAGVCPKETFDVTPHVIGLTEALLPDPLSYQLPRKYKIAFSGCSEDCASATINDLGFIAKQRDGVDGFSVWVAGGMGIQSRTSSLLEEFVPAGDALLVAEAIKRVFDRHGNRKNRHRARLRFLLEELGLERFRELYRAELGAPPAAGSAPITEPEVTMPPVVDGVIPQKQDGFVTVEIGRGNGAVTADQLRRLADVVDRFGERQLRVTNWQRPLLRWVRPEDGPALYRALARIGLAGDEPTILQRMVVCAGASTCRLGICLSRGLAEAIRIRLLGGGVDLKGKAGRVSLNISGCPNACGRHPVAAIGLFGAARRVNGRIVPHYMVQLGGRVKEGSTELASGRIPVPARNVPSYLLALLQSYAASDAADFHAFLDAGGRQKAAELGTRFAAIPAFEDDPGFYADYGAGEPFSLGGRGEAECGAGVFDLIRLDLVAASEALAAGRLRDATVAAARSLLVTRGQEATSDLDALDLFDRHFVATGMVLSELSRTLAQARDGEPSAEGVAQLVDAVRQLYQAMGPSLRLPDVAPVAH